MPDTDYLDELEDLEEPSEAPQWVKDLRKQNRELAKQVKEQSDLNATLAEKAKRGLFLEAGLDLNDPRHQDFMAAYSGEETPTAVQEAARARGYLAKSEDELASEEERDAHAKAAALAGGAQATPIPDKQAQYDQAMSGVRSQADVLRVMREHGREIDSIVR